MEISSNFCGLLRSPTILPLFRKFHQITRNRAGGTRWGIAPQILADLETKPVLSNDLLHISVCPPPPDFQIFRRLWAENFSRSSLRQPVQERHSFERHSRVHSQNLSEAWAPLISKSKSEDWAPLNFGGEWSQRVHSFKKPKNLWNFNPNPFFLRYAQNNM